MGKATLPILVALALIASQGSAEADDGWTVVPPTMQGIWGKMGRCDVEDDRLTLTPDAAAFGHDILRSVHYSPDDNTVYWVEEYESANIKPGFDSNFLIYNSQGNNMPGRIGYERCGADLARLPWPFRAGPVKKPD